MSERADIALRAWAEDDIAFLTKLRNDVELQALLLSTARGSDAAAVRDWLVRRSTGTDRLFRVITDAASGTPIGYIQADATAQDDAVWQFGICLDWPFQGAGRGTLALRALEALVSSMPEACHLRLTVDAANRRAIHCYERLGYERIPAVLEPVLVNGEWRPVFEMARRLDGSAAA